MIGIPRGLFYYLYGIKWELYFKILNIKYIVSPETNKDIIKRGCDYANDEMCLSVKTYLGHVAYLKDKCNYILVPRIDNYGIDNQTCTNFLALYDIVNNLFPNKVLNYNINYLNNETEEKGFIKIGRILGKTKKECKKAYQESNIICQKLDEINIQNNIDNMSTKKKKILLVGHPYNVKDNYIGKPIIKILEDNNAEVIYSYLFDHNLANQKAYELSHNIYWKYSKEIIGSIKLSKVDGIVFLSSFPCGLDSLVNELVIRKINIPYLNIIVDDMSSLAGFETRIESFMDLLGGQI